MSTGCEIEKIAISDQGMEHNAASGILEQDGIVMVAAGSLACVRSLWFQAYRRGKSGQFIGLPLPAWNYAVGKNGEKIVERIRDVSQHTEAKGIIVYASCMEYLTQWDLEAENLGREWKLPVGVLFRGPLTKRTGSPLDALEKLLGKMELQREASDRSNDRKKQDCGRNREKGEESQRLNSLPPVAPDFSGVLSFLSEIDGNAILISPGGCKSCIEYVDGFKNFEQKSNQYGTRFMDLSVTGGCEDVLATTLCSTFSDEKALFLVGSAVMQMIGFDGKYLEKSLLSRGKSAVFLDCNGFEGCPEAVDRAMLEIGKRCYAQAKSCRNRQVLITGYTSLAVGEKEVLEPVIRHLSKMDISVQYLGENWEKEERQLPAVTWMVSGEGVSVSEWMQEAFGVPCVIGRNLGEICADDLAKEIKSCIENPHCAGNNQFPKHIVEKGEKSRETVWIIGEPVLTISICRFCMEHEKGQEIKAGVYVPTPGMRRVYGRLSDEWIYFETQEEMAETICEGTVIADELIIRFLQSRHPDIKGIAVKFPEISGNGSLI